jgi:nucleoside-diphosphate-sugar epimerase
MKRILITGANGFIGSTLVDLALEKGWEVTAAVRPTSDTTYLKNPLIQFLEINFNNEKDLIQKLHDAGRFDYIIHNAGTTKALNIEGYLSVNTENTRRFVNILRGDMLRPDKFLFVSSLASIGPTKGQNIINPQYARNPVTGYGESKKAAELYLESLDDFPWVAIQPTAVYGPRDKEMFAFIKLVNRGIEFNLGTKSQNMSFIYSKDLTSMMIAALENGHIGKKYLATDGQFYKTEDLGKAVKTALNKKALTIKVPLSIVHIVANISENIGKIRQKAPMLNREKMNELAAESWLCDMNETFTDLDFQPQYNLYSGMLETVNWYRQQKWI